MDKNRRLLLIFILLLTLGGAIYYVTLNPALVSGALVGLTSEAEATTPYGESLSIELTSGSSTSGTASWLNDQLASFTASYDDTDSQNVYEVNSTYKSQEQVTLEYSASVPYANVDSITITVKIKAIDKGTPANYNEYILANAKSISGVTPISDSGDTTPSIVQHLTDIGGSTTSETVEYQIYAQVQGTGTISGDTLTAEVAYTPFGTLVYAQSSESSTVEMTPTVSVASYIDEAAGLPDGSSLTALAIVAVLITMALYWRR
jgi:hypothetical protein